MGWKETQDAAIAAQREFYAGIESLDPATARSVA